jgi:uncharacterized membrane protein
MNIESIKNRAREVLALNKVAYMRVLVIVLLINCIPSLFTATNTIVSIIRFISVIICIPASHGIIVSSLKMVRNNSSLVNDEDGFVGIKRFGELFPTYLAVSFIEFIIIFLIGFIFGIIVAVLYGNNILQFVNYSSNPELLLNYIMNTSMGLIMLLLIFVVVVAIVMFILEAYLFATPYILEQYHVTGFNAIKLSYNMMKGHIKDYFKLFLSFFGWMVLMFIIEMAISSFISISLVVSVIVGLFKIATYLPLYSLSQTVLFEEIAFYYNGGE